MKKVLFSVFLAAVLLSCGNRNYTLEGRAQSAEMNGVTVVINTFDGERWSNLTDIVVENQRFVIRGSAREPMIARLEFNDRERQIRGRKAFVLENTHIQFDIDENMLITMSGSSDNDLLQSFENDLAALISQEFIDSVQGGLVPELELQARIQGYSAKRTAMIIDFSKKHINTLPGTLIFTENSHALPIEDRIAVLDLMNARTRDNSRVRMVAQQVETEQSVAIGNQFVDFGLLAPAGEILSLSDFVGNHDYVLLQFWASWCGPCIRALPELIEFYNSQDRRRFEVFAVSLDNDRAAWEGAIERHNIPWVQVSDLLGFESPIGQLYAVTFIPTKILIDRNGTIVGRNLSISEMAERMN